MKKKYKLIPAEPLIEAAKKDPVRRAHMEAHRKYYDKVTAEFEAARKKKKMSQKELSKKSGVPISIISKVENGKRNPTLGTMMKLADGMGKKLEIKLK